MVSLWWALCLIASVGAKAATPVAWWQFNGDLAETYSGTLPGINSSVVSLSRAGPYLRSVSSNASGSGATVLSFVLPLPLSASQDWALAFWAALPFQAGSSAYHTLTLWATPNTYAYYIPLANSTSCRIYCHGCAEYTVSSPNYGCPTGDGDWEHWAFVTSNNTTLVYHNTALQQYTFSNNMSESPAISSWSSLTVHGGGPVSLSDLRFYNTSLDAGQVGALYVAPGPQPPPPPPPPVVPSPPPPPWQAIPNAVPMQALVNTSWSQVAVSTQTIGRMKGDFIGYSMEKSGMTVGMFTPNSGDLIALFKKWGPGVLRIGGNSANTITWDQNGAGFSKGATVGPPDVQALAGFLSATGWSVIYGLNAVSPINTIAYVTPDTANTAAEAAYVYQTLGGSLANFEIGNEPDIYYYRNGAGLKFSGYNYTYFLQDWDTYRSAILSATNGGALFSGPALAGHRDWWSFATDRASEIVQFTTHEYSDPVTLTNVGDMLVSTSVEQRQTVAQNAILNNLTLALPGGFRYAETNSYWYSATQPNYQAVVYSFAAALFAIQHCFYVAMANGTGVNFHGGAGTGGYAPIGFAKTSGLISSALVQPEYYGMFLVSMMGPGNVVNTTTTGNAAGLHAYSMSGDGAQVGPSLVLINADPTDIAAVSLQLTPGFVAPTAILLTAPNLTTVSGITFGGSSILNGGTWDPDTIYEVVNDMVWVPPGSALLIQGSIRTPPVPMQALVTYPTPSIYNVSTLLATVNGVLVDIIQHATPADTPQGTNPNFCPTPRPPIAQQYMHFSFEGQAVVTIQSASQIGTFAIYPLNTVVGDANGSTLTFVLYAPQYLSVQIDELTKIFVFADPLEEGVPSLGQPGVVDASQLPLTGIDDTAVVTAAMSNLSSAGGGVLYFPPGVYSMGTLNILSNVQVYLAGGAVILGTTNFTSFTRNHGCSAAVPSTDLVFVRVYNQTNVSLTGRGTIDGNGYQEAATSTSSCLVLVSLLNVVGGSNITIGGIIERAGTSFSNYIARAQHVTVDRLKLVQYECEGNTDGLEVADSSDIVVRNTFIHNGDDAFTVQAYTSATLPFWLTEYTGASSQPYNTSNILFTDNVIWSAAAAYRIGASVDAPIQNVVFQNTQVIQSSGLYAYITESAATWVDNVTFENITISFVQTLRGTNHAIYVGNTVCTGNMSNFIFKNIAATNIPNPEVVLCGSGTDYHVYVPNVQTCAGVPVGTLTNVTLDNVIINGAGVSTVITNSTCNSNGGPDLVSGVVIQGGPPPGAPPGPPGPVPPVPVMLPAPPAPGGTQRAVNQRVGQTTMPLGLYALAPSLAAPFLIILSRWRGGKRRLTLHPA